MIDYQIHKFNDRIEACAELHFYGAAGYYKVNVLGFGRNEKAAIDSANDMARRARTALQLATIDDELNRVPENTQPENANERTTEHRT